ncbi:hypothetical protein [Streptacidiphilus sp. MAP12-33]|uniref:hypothetical protein n=1 Tax=Streptacidiphilus sp. MAP12-33 TaxID=3156266 RepID=UPI003511810F
MQQPFERLAQAQGRLSRLVDIARRASEVPVGAFEDQDRSGSVRVRLAEDGLPESIRLLSGWRGKCGTGGLSGAVLEAAQQAMARRMASWAKALDDSGVTEMVATVDQPAAAPAAGHAGQERSPFQAAAYAAQEPPRELSAIVEDAFSLLDAFDGGPGGGGLATGTHAGGSTESVSIVLTEHAIRSCVVDSRWAETQDDGRIEAALRSALHEARQAAATRGPDFRDRSGALVAELMARIAGVSQGSRPTSTREGAF